MKRFAFISAHHKFLAFKISCLLWNFVDNTSKCFETIFILMQDASDALSKTADSDTVSTYQVSSVQLVIDKKLEAFNKA